MNQSKSRNIIGFRCWDRKFAYVVISVSSDSPNLTAHSICLAPADKSRAEELMWLRVEVHEILSKYEPVFGFFKTTESNSKTKSLQRAEFEGVLQEACITHSCKLNLESRMKSQIKRDTGYEGAAKDVQNVLSKFDLASLNNGNYAEAALAAICGLKALNA